MRIRPLALWHAAHAPFSAADRLAFAIQVAALAAILLVAVRLFAFLWYEFGDWRYWFAATTTALLVALVALTLLFAHVRIIRHNEWHERNYPGGLK